jgi:hypothetical protein
MAKPWKLKDQEILEKHVREGRSAHYIARAMSRTPRFIVPRYRLACKALGVEPKIHSSDPIESALPMPDPSEIGTLKGLVSAYTPEQRIAEMNPKLRETLYGRRT